MGGRRVSIQRQRVGDLHSQEVAVTRPQAIALILLGVLFVIALAILTVQVIHGGFDLDQLPD